MNSIEILVHKCPGENPVPVAIAIEATVLDLLKQIDPDGHEDLILIIEGDEKPLERHHTVHHAGLRHHTHVHSQKLKVEITINGKRYEVRKGDYTVAQIKDIPTPKIPKDDSLCQMVDGEPKELKPGTVVHIKGGEVFASNCPSAGTS